MKRYRAYDIEYAVKDGELEHDAELLLVEDVENLIVEFLSQLKVLFGRYL